MSYLQFPAVNKIKAIDHTMDEKIGSFKVASATNLRHIVLHIYAKGPHNSAEKIRLKLYPSSRYGTPTATSAWARLYDIENFNGGNWVGSIRLDFDGQPLNPNYYYHMGLETSGYVRNGDVSYLAVNFDYASSLSNRVSPNDLAVLMAVLGDK